MTSETDLFFHYTALFLTKFLLLIQIVSTKQNLQKWNPSRNCPWNFFTIIISLSRCSIIAKKSLISKLSVFRFSLVSKSFFAVFFM